MMRKSIILMICCLMLSHCASIDFSQRKKQQGNLLPAYKLKRLHIGMSKQEASVIMGTSLISPIFNKNRWDYVYTLQKGNGHIKKRRIILYFQQGRLSKIDASLNEAE
ncbi:outer membrane protein assembly factor BamE [Legionella sp. W05-934-2]|uniref:outer membrane protein assembly factor BamE n=1 Tax=Legionella sp. W05-934-2 TaxID=1198649 RepID=UPI003462E937